MVIEGKLKIPKKLKSLGKLKKTKYINASYSKLKDLGDLEEVGELYIYNTSITSLGNKLKKVRKIYSNDELKKEAKEKRILKS